LVTVTFDGLTSKDSNVEEEGSELVSKPSPPPPHPERNRNSARVKQKESERRIMSGLDIEIRAIIDSITV